MFETLRFKFKRWRAEANYAKAQKKARAAVKATMLKFPGVTPEEAWSEHGPDLESLHDELRRFVSDYWVDCAEKHDVPIPTAVGTWERPQLGRIYMSATGVNQVRRDIWVVKRDSDSVFHGRYGVYSLYAAGLYATWQTLLDAWNWWRG